MQATPSGAFLGPTRRAITVLERAFSDNLERASDFYDRDTLLDIALSGGFPEALALGLYSSHVRTRPQLNPYEYLTHIFKQLPNVQSIDDVAVLLLWAVRFH